MEDEKGIYIKPTTGLPEGEISQKIVSQKPQLTVMWDGRSDTKNPEGIYIKPTIGLQEGQVGKALKSQSIFAKTRRSLAKFLDRIDTNLEK